MHSLSNIIVVAVALVIVATTYAVAAAAAAAASIHLTQNPKADKLGLYTMAEDPFVCNAPLIAAMVCNDGIALLATHIDEPLQFDPISKTNGDATNHNGISWVDLSTPSYNQRILALGRSGSVMMTCGWRADGHGRLMDSARAILARNVQLFGQERIETLPGDLANVMTTCAGSESVRITCADVWVCIVVYLAREQPDQPNSLCVFSLASQT
jgi:hypothetical protein